MTRNEGRTDRIVRTLAGLALIAAWPLGLTTGVLAVAVGLIGVVLLVTGVVGFCPLYALLGLSTCPAEPSGSGR